MGPEINLNNNNNNNSLWNPYMYDTCQRKSKKWRKYDEYCVDLKKVRDRKTQHDLCK